MMRFLADILISIDRRRPEKEAAVLFRRIFEVPICKIADNRSIIISSMDEKSIPVRLVLPEKTLIYIEENSKFPAYCLL